MVVTAGGGARAYRVLGRGGQPPVQSDARTWPGPSRFVLSCNAISGGETKVWRGGSRCPGLQSSRCQASGGTGASPCLQGGQSLARPVSPVSTDCVWYSGQGRGWWGLLTRMKGDPFATLECSWSSALRLASSRPPSASIPRKGTLCWGVLTVSSLPVVSGENSSFSEPSGLECPHDAVGLSAWLTHGGSERFLPVVRSGGWAWWSLRGCPVQKTPPCPPSPPCPQSPPVLGHLFCQWEPRHWGCGRFLGFGFNYLTGRGSERDW